MTTKTIETVTDEQLAELEALRQGADYLAYQAFAVMLAPKMAAHLADFREAGAIFVHAWQHETEDGTMSAAVEHIGALCGVGPSDFLLILAREVERLRAIEEQSKATTAAVKARLRSGGAS